MGKKETLVPIFTRFFISGKPVQQDYDEERKKHYICENESL